MRSRISSWYIVTVGVATAAVMLLVTALYVVTDPQGLIGTPLVGGINAIKPYLEHNRALARWRNALRVCPNAAILGNSRAEIGFDPNHPAFSALGLEAFNLAIPGTGLSTSLDQASWLRNAGCAPKLMIVGIDFPDFLSVDTPTGADRFLPTPAPPPQFGVRSFVESVMSLRGLRDASETLLVQWRVNAPITTSRGLNPLRSYIPEIQRTGQYTLFRQRAEDNYRSWRKRTRSVANGAGNESPEFGYLRALLASADLEQTRTVLIIYPYHAQLRLILDSLGYADAFDDWKRRVVKLVEEARRTNPNVSVWDFSLLSDVTLESIPPPGDKTRSSRWYWEGGHFRRELGDRMLDQLLLRALGFGVELDSATLDETLVGDRRRMSEVARGSTMADDVAQIAHSNERR